MRRLHLWSAAADASAARKVIKVGCMLAEQVGSMLATEKVWPKFKQLLLVAHAEPTLP